MKGWVPRAKSTLFPPPGPPCTQHTLVPACQGLQPGSCNKPPLSPWRHARLPVVRGQGLGRGLKSWLWESSEDA